MSQDDLCEDFGRNQVIRRYLSRLETHSPGEAEHAHRVSLVASLVGFELGLEADDLQTLRRAALLHDIGKLLISNAILSAGSALLPAQREVAESHGVLARELLISDAFLHPCLPAITAHHERWDGAGYPSGATRTDIPLGARIIGLAEAFDVIAYGSSYRKPLGVDAALEEIQRHAGTQFDPQLVPLLGEAAYRVNPILL
jgi:HD-GYP domain-containing protein (c-di-GMP phosphodiesterase class II)